MSLASRLSGIARSPADPRVLQVGPSVRSRADRLARGLGWFSLALGTAELLAAGRMSRALGVPNRSGLVRAFGVREIGAGIAALSITPAAGTASRIAGDALDIAALLAARRGDNPHRGRVDAALAMVVGITVLDVICHRALRARHGRQDGAAVDYSDRSGLPRGIEASRGLAGRRDPSPVAELRSERVAAPA